MQSSPDKATQNPLGLDPTTRALYRHLDEALSPLNLSAGQRRLIEHARDIAAIAHRGQTRPDGSPYINHPVRVALTAVTKFGVSDPSLIIAALLHDTVEDKATALIQALGGVTSGIANETESALAAIECHFGSRTREVVAHLTNPDFDELAVKAAMRGDQREIDQIKRDLYKAHFLEILSADAEAFVIKLSDFGENAFQLADLSGEKRAKLTKKYGPVILATLEAFESLATDHPLAHRRGSIMGELREVYERDYR